MKNALLIALGIFTVCYLVIWLSAIFRGDGHRRRWPGPLDAGIGFFTNFLDTLGIGSFATTSSLFKLGKLVPDEQIPGTLNVGHTLPTVVEAIIYIAVLGAVDVDITTLVLMIAASAVGAWLGAGIVSAWPRRKIQIGMGSVMVAAAVIMAIRQFSLIHEVGTPDLTGTKLIAAVVGNAVLGALMTLGIGLYAPCMILVALLGMNPKAAYPIMTGSCAFLMPVGSARFIRTGSYNLKSAIGLTLGGIPGVLMATYLIKSLPLYAIKWLVVAVLLYTAAMMLRSAHKERGTRLAEAHGDLPADATAEASGE